LQLPQQPTVVCAAAGGGHAPTGTTTGAPTHYATATGDWQPLMPVTTPNECVSANAFVTIFCNKLGRTDICTNYRATTRRAHLIGSCLRRIWGCKIRVTNGKKQNLENATVQVM
jgi:hypothetical protein